MALVRATSLLLDGIFLLLGGREVCCGDGAAIDMIRNGLAFVFRVVGAD
jgi:hypothetical protein